MSRSRRRTPIIGIAASSDKQCKRLANRKLRRMTSEMLRCGSLEDDVVLPEIQDVSNVWDMNKDGKMYLKEPSDKDLRK